MPVNLNLDRQLDAIKALPPTSTQWTTLVAELLRDLFRSDRNPFTRNAALDAPPEGTGFPVGGIVAFATSGPTSGRTTLAPGFVRCAGQGLSRTTYAALFRVCGTRFGFGDSDSFNVPNIRRRQIVGRDADYPVGTLAGSETKLVSVNNLPTHRHGHSSMTVSVRPDHGHTHSYVYGKNEFPALEGGSVAVIAPCPDLHRVPDGTRGWRHIPGNPNDFPAGRSGTPSAVQSGSDGAHGHALPGRVTNAYGGAEAISIIGPSIVLDFGIYTGVA